MNQQQVKTFRFQLEFLAKLRQLNDLALLDVIQSIPSNVSLKDYLTTQNFQITLPDHYNLQLQLQEEKTKIREERRDKGKEKFKSSRSEKLKESKESLEDEFHYFYFPFKTSAEQKKKSAKVDCIKLKRDLRNDVEHFRTSLLDSYSEGKTDSAEKLDTLILDCVNVIEEQEIQLNRAYFQLGCYLEVLYRAFCDPQTLESDHMSFEEAFNLRYKRRVRFGWKWANDLRKIFLFGLDFPLILFGSCNIKDLMKFRTKIKKLIEKFPEEGAFWDNTDAVNDDTHIDFDGRMIGIAQKRRIANKPANTATKKKKRAPVTSPLPVLTHDQQPLRTLHERLFTEKEKPHTSVSTNPFANSQDNVKITSMPSSPTPGSPQPSRRPSQEFMMPYSPTKSSNGEPPPLPPLKTPPRRNESTKS